MVARAFHARRCPQEHRTSRADVRVGCRHLSLCGAHGRPSGQGASAIVVQLLRWHSLLLLEDLGAGELLLGRGELGCVLLHHGLGG